MSSLFLSCILCPARLMRQPVIGSQKIQWLMQATVSLSRLSHERPEYLWLVLRKPGGNTPEPCGELRVRLQWTPAPLRKAGTGEGTG